MGYVAAIAGIIGAATSIGTSAYNASQAGGASGIMPTKINSKDVTDLNLGSATTGLTAYLDQQPQLPALQSMLNQENSLSNDAWQQQLSSLDPSLLSSISTLGTNTLSELNGQLPTDVQNQIQNDTAYQALNGGYSGTGMARNLTARDLGLTSLNLQNTGTQNLGTELNYTSALNPANASLSSLLFSPQQLLQRQDNQTQYNTDLNNQVAFYNAGAQNAGQMGAALGSQNQNAMLSGLGGQINSLLNSKTNQNSLNTLFGSVGGDPDPDSQYFTNDSTNNSSPYVSDVTGSSTGDPDPDSLYLGDETAMFG